MKFIGRVSTVNLADISPGGETKSGLSRRLAPAISSGDPLDGGLLVFITFHDALLYHRLGSPPPFYSSLCPRPCLLPVSAAECQPNDGKKKLKAAAEVMETGCEVNDEEAGGSR